MAETLLQLMTDAGIISDEVAGLNEEIQKVELPRFGLEKLIVSNRRLQGFVKQRCEIRIAGRDEGFEIVFSLVAAGKDLVPRQSAKGRSPGALPAPAPDPGQPAQLRLEPVVVTAAHHLDSVRLFNEAGDLGDIAGE